MGSVFAAAPALMLGSAAPSAGGSLAGGGHLPAGRAVERATGRPMVAASPPRRAPAQRGGSVARGRGAGKEPGRGGQETAASSLGLLSFLKAEPACRRAAAGRSWGLGQRHGAAGGGEEAPGRHG